jgi:hypothetical protein
MPTAKDARPKKGRNFSVRLSSKSSGTIHAQARNPSGANEKHGTDKPSSSPLKPHE